MSISITFAGIHSPELFENVGSGIDVLISLIEPLYIT